MLPSPMHQVLDDVEGDRNEKDRNQACGQHPAEDGEAEQDPSVRPGASSQDQRERRRG